MRKLLLVLTLLILALACDDDNDNSEFSLNSFFEEECIISKEIEINPLSNDTMLIRDYNLENEMYQSLSIQLNGINTYFQDVAFEYVNPNQMTQTIKTYSLLFGDTTYMKNHFKRVNDDIYYEKELNGTNELSQIIYTDNGLVSMIENYYANDLTNSEEFERKEDTVTIYNYNYQNNEKVLFSKKLHYNFDSNKSIPDNFFKYKLFKNNPLETKFILMNKNDSLSHYPDSLVTEYRYTYNEKGYPTSRFPINSRQESIEYNHYFDYICK